MNCIAILRKSPNAGQRCPNKATRAGWCKVHDPMTVVPRLERKRERLTEALKACNAAIDSYKEPEPIENPS